MRRRASWALACLLLSVALHVAPVWFILFGPVYDASDPLEIDLRALNSFRERVFRELGAARQAPPPPPMSLSVMTKTPLEQKLRLAAPREEEDLNRARIIQQAIRALWERMYCSEAGYAVVRLNVLEDGRIGGYAVTRLNGNAEFQAFLSSFLTTFQASYGDQAGPGQSMNLECEFVVKPSLGRGKS